MSQDAGVPSRSHTVAGDRLDAVLFDMDGVVTDTARAHAAAWQRLFDDYLGERAARGERVEPFDPVRDYRRHIDGKPRYDGVQSFLESRGIALPWGTDSDPPECETVCGLGNRKNRHFRAWLAENRVRPYPGALRLIAELRAAGICAAVFSASRNAEAVLQSAGVSELFDARVDGADLGRLGLPGKPDPAMLLEAARRLGVAPGRSAVVEDAIAGVRAAARGGFRVVIGIDRDDYGDDLEAAGAHWVVHDPAELCVVGGSGLSVRTFANRQPVWQCQGEITSRLAGKRLAVFLDYDGTLTPIVEDHTRALLAADMREALAALADHCRVTIVSGRDLGRLRELIGIGTIWYAGSHGFEIAGPQEFGERFEKGTEYLPALDRAETRLGERLATIPGHALERKRFSIAVHYRRVAQEDVGRVATIVDAVLADYRQLRRARGKKVFEIRPDLDWGKGEAVDWILERFGRDGPDVVPLYVGDDITDEDAFRALAGRGPCIAVRHDETRPTAADYVVTDTRDVKRLLEWLSAVGAGDPARGAGGCEQPVPCSGHGESKRRPSPR